MIGISYMEGLICVGLSLAGVVLAIVMIYGKERDK